MILFGYFLDQLLIKYLVGTYFYPCLAFVFVLISYLHEKNFDRFLLKTGVQCFLAFLFFNQNFFLDFSYFLLFYLLLMNLFPKNLSKWELFLSLLFFIIGYYTYGEIIYFFLQTPLSFSKYIHIILISLPFNLIIIFLYSLVFGLITKKN